MPSLFLNMDFVYGLAILRPLGRLSSLIFSNDFFSPLEIQNPRFYPGMNFSLLIYTSQCQFYSRKGADSKMLLPSCSDLPYVNICFYVLNKDYCDIFLTIRDMRQNIFLFKQLFPSLVRFQKCNQVKATTVVLQF